MAPFSFKPLYLIVFVLGLDALAPRLQLGRLSSSRRSLLYASLESKQGFPQPPPTPSSLTDVSTEEPTSGDTNNDQPLEAAAATGTVNERLMAGLEEAANREKYGSRSSPLSPFGLPAKTDAEREQAIAEARNLNGVNPVTAVVGSLVALAGAAAFWYLTGFLADVFAHQPIDPDAPYFVARLTSVFRNVVIGLVSLAAGFFGVTGIGILALGVRVGYGVVTGELDPTPRSDAKAAASKVDMGEVWDFMTGESNKRGRR